jgi:RNA polymerase sigma-70 factor, ECF subfamily
VVQEVFIVAHERLAEFQGRSSLRTWLCGIGAKKSLHILRRRRRLSWFGLAGAPEPTSQVTPDSLSEADERAVAVRAAIAQLPEDQRAVVVLRMFEGLTFPQIAAALEIRLPTAESRMARARQKLRGLLDHLDLSTERSTT